MKKSAWWFCIILAGACQSLHAIDFTPCMLDRENIDFSRNHPYFVDGEAKYQVNLPPGTTLSGEKDEAHFYFSNLEGAVFSIKTSPQKPTVPFAGASLDVYRKLALNLAPPRSTDVMIRKEIPDAIPKEGWSSYSFIVSSNYPGTPMMQQITFLNFNEGGQLVLITSASARRFEDAMARTKAIMDSWKNISSNGNAAPPAAN